MENLYEAHNVLNFYNSLQQSLCVDEASLLANMEIMMELRMNAALMEVKTAALCHHAVFLYENNKDNNDSAEDAMDDNKNQAKP